MRIQSAVVLLIMLAQPAQAAVVATSMSPNRCLAAKMKVAGKSFAALQGCYAKNAASADVVKLSACVTKAFVKFYPGDPAKDPFGKSEAKYPPMSSSPCLTFGDASTMANFVISVVSGLNMALNAGGGDSKCDGARLKCIGKYVAAQTGCLAKAAGKTGAVDPACIQKSLGKFSNGGGSGCFDKALGKGDCEVPGDTTARLATSDFFVNEVTCDLDPGSPACGSAKRVFLSSLPLPGNFYDAQGCTICGILGACTGGLAGADGWCQCEAFFLGAPGTYKAWLSDATTSASSRLTHATQPYVLVDGTQVADDWADLTDGTLDAPINKGSSGATIPGQEAWTGSNPAGALLGNTCVSWTTGAGWGHFGIGDSTTATWTDSFVAPCTELRRLYCIEQ